MLIINPGSENRGGTLEEARIIAKEYLDQIHKEGYTEVEMTELEHDDYFNFLFKHKVTGKGVELNTHGFTREECEEFMFTPRIYWNGSSCSSPKIEDWLTDGYEPFITYKKVSTKQ